MLDQSKQGKLEYQSMVDQASPNSNLFTNCLKAFVSGGIICTIGQCIMNYASSMGASKDDAGLITTIVLILASAVLTAFGLYSKLGKFCGAGTIVPVTGFANSVVSPAIEFKKEGWVFGMAAKMFILAGPVIVYGTLASFVVGIVYLVLGGGAS